MPKPKHDCWPRKLKQHISRVAKKSKKSVHANRLRSILLDSAAELDEVFNQTHTRILEAHPHIPVKFFGLAVQVPYRIALKRYKAWYVRAGIKPPLTGRTSAEARQKWLQVVMEEIVTK